MAKIDLENLTIVKAHEAMKSGDFTAEELAQAYLERIKEINPELNVYLEVFDDVLAQAKKADERFESGKDIDILTGIPFAVKDNILIKSRKCSAGSKMLENYVAVYDATVIKKLKEKGVVFLGRVNMDEFAMGGSTENSAFGVTKNPHDKKRVAGGSSGGSASAVGANLALVALGSDTGGSIRQPASFCGVTGLKPTYGAVSRYGVVAMASSLDQIGPLAKNVEDTEIVYRAIAGADGFDSNAFDIDTNEDTSVKLRIAVPYSFFSGGGIDKEVLDNFNEVVKKLKNDGHEIFEVEMPNLHYSLACYYILMPAEVSSNLARFDGVRYGLHLDGKDVVDDYFKTRGVGFGKEVRRRIMLGTYVLSAGYYDAFYNKANQVRTLIKKDYEKVFEKFDVIITPTAPNKAFLIGEKISDPLQMYLEDIFTVPVNLAGLPAMSIPSGKTSDNLPLAIQVTVPAGREDLVFAFGRIIESFQ